MNWEYYDVMLGRISGQRRRRKPMIGQSKHTKCSPIKLQRQIMRNTNANVARTRQHKMAVIESRIVTSRLGTWRRYS